MVGCGVSVMEVEEDLAPICTVCLISGADVCMDPGLLGVFVWWDIYGFEVGWCKECAL